MEVPVAKEVQKCSEVDEDRRKNRVKQEKNNEQRKITREKQIDIDKNR